MLFFTIPFLYIFRTNNATVRKWWCQFVLNRIGVKLELIGNIDDSAGFYILNHQSLLDIMAVEILTPKQDIAWVAKKELFDMFYFGHLLKAPRMIKVDREDKKGLFALL
ncbi:MAG: 1-acylglycerol-3-phosphate O-acyltransferase, partial [Pseudomonadota bacterium]